MVFFQRTEPLPHIEVQREPDQRDIRPRRAVVPGGPPRGNRLEHSQALKQQTSIAVEELASVRRILGIDPARLLVLRFEILDVDQRETLERLGAAIVEELVERRDKRAIHRVLAQFPDEDTLRSFTNEFNHYAEESPATTALPAGQRRTFMDALESVSTVSPDERRGRRLGREGFPAAERFYLDVDLWNPGSIQHERQVLAEFRTFMESRGGRIVKDPLTIPSLILVKVEVGAQLAESLLQLDLVSLVDLSPQPLPQDAFDLFADVAVPDPLPAPPADGPLACFVDSGVVPGQPLLRGTVIEAVDFESGENTPIDQHGHGTGIAGLVVYGDIARCSVEGTWNPQVAVCSAKVLRLHVDPTRPSEGFVGFPDEERAEDQLRKAIEYFHRERGIRIFNLSIGHPDRLYAGGRQWPWAELLDELARRLDIVIVLSAGNVSNPVLPAAVNSQQLQGQVLEGLASPDHRLIDPATVALSLTVGSIARRSDPYQGIHGMRLAAVDAGCPSPFTRCGPGVAGAVKPELVDYGGNLGIDHLGNQARWVRQDPQLGEPTLNHAFVSGRMLTAMLGTSFAAAHVTHIAARVESALREYLGRPPTANLVRALVVNSARIDAGLELALEKRQDIILNTVGYGRPSVEACWSSPNRVTLIAEDTVPYKTFHVYALRLPESFLAIKGERRVVVTLAYDPPTRLSRKEYIANRMWLEIFRGLTAEQVFEFRSRYQGDGEPPIVPNRHKLAFVPSRQTVWNSTVQSRSWHSNRSSKLDYRPAADAEATFHVLVGCQPRFPNPFGEEDQRYAIVVTLEHSDVALDLYQQVQQQARVRTRLRVRP